MKKIIGIILVLVLCLGLSACNYQMIDSVYQFDTAIISLPDGTYVKGKCDGWRDYDDGSDFVQVKIGEKIYYTHVSNVVLIKE